MLPRSKTVDVLKAKHFSIFGISVKTTHQHTSTYSGRIFQTMLHSRAVWEFQKQAHCAAVTIEIRSRKYLKALRLTIAIFCAKSQLYPNHRQQPTPGAVYSLVFCLLFVCTARALTLCLSVLESGAATAGAPMSAERRLSITRNIVRCAVYCNLQHQVVAIVSRCRNNCCKTGGNCMNY